MLNLSSRFFKITRNRYFLILCFALITIPNCLAQEAIKIDSGLTQHIFQKKQIEYLIDTSGLFNIAEISNHSHDAEFKPSITTTPHTQNINFTYWYRIKIRQDSSVKMKFILEFFDQTIDDIWAYLPDRNGNYTLNKLGDSRKFKTRELKHKNFVLEMDNYDAREHEYYFRVKSSQIADVIIVIRSEHWFFGYALSEYFFFGIFYGMILIFSFYNLIMFLAIRQKQYLFYVLYNLSVGLYEMCSDGIAYQYLWPDASAWNQIAYGVMLFTTSVFALLFTDSLLNLKQNAPRLHLLVNTAVLARILFFVVCILWKPYWFNYKFLEYIPLSLCYFIGIWRFLKGYQPARFFVLGYTFLFTGFTLKLIILLGIQWLNTSIFSYYSLSFCFILEMCCLAFALGDRVRYLKIGTEKAQEETIAQMAINAKLQQGLQKQLEEKVAERTREVNEQAEIISSQNQSLVVANQQLLLKSEEILKMNMLLEMDNTALQINVSKVTKARVLSTSMTFDEFSKTYPDQESCFKLLSDLKWSNGFSCKKCVHGQYTAGRVFYSRRCAKCRYEESVTAYTLFQNTKIPINKAFYMTFLIYSTKGKISSHKLSELLDIRQGTCYTYGSKIKKVLDDRKKELKGDTQQGWTLLVLD